jgi:hypothetical protein
MASAQHNFRFTAHRRVLEAANQNYYLTANNDECVKETITQKFWMGRSDASAINKGV